MSIRQTTFSGGNEDAQLEPHMKYLNEYPGRCAGDIRIITFFAQNDTYSFSARIRIGERNELLQRSQSYFRLSIEWGHETRKLS